MMSKSFIKLPFLLLLLLSLAAPAAAQENIPVLNAVVENHFGEHVTFSVDLPGELNIESVRIIIAMPGEFSSQSFPVTIGANNHISFIYDFDKLSQFRPFSQVSYAYEVTLISTPSNTISLTEELFFIYEDNRFTWQTVNNNTPFTIHWYEGGEDFGQAVLEAATAAVKDSKDQIQLPIPRALDIYVYASAAELQEALNLVDQSWAAGHAETDLNLALVSITPGEDQKNEINRQIPHELMHIRLRQTYGNGFLLIPAWLNEGLASSAEINPPLEITQLLSAAFKNNALLSFSGLCQGFPEDATGANLAYDQSVSFTRYLFDRFGVEGVQQLLSSYTAGEGCAAGFHQALGSSLAQVELNWQLATFGSNPAELAKVDFSPWLVLLGIILLSPFIVIIFNRKPIEETPDQAGV